MVGLLLKREELEEAKLEILGYNGKYRCLKPDQLSILVPDLTFNTDMFDK